jgi:23S rRNA G2445 N2-methylase RlmL
LFEYDGTLFCGHDSGTFIIEKASVKIYRKSGTWKFESVSGQKAFARQLLWDFGIEKVNNQWRFRNKITGFDSSARYFEITDALEVYVVMNIVLGCS